jgi:Tol biopolymer transport system component
VRFTQNTVDDIKPRLNRGASRLVFVSNRDGNPEIYAANVDGSDIHRMTDSITEDTDPAWSPDSSKIAFASSRDGQRRFT